MRVRRFFQRGRGVSGTNLTEWLSGAFLLGAGLILVRQGDGVLGYPWLVVGALICGVSLLVEGAHCVVGFSGRRRLRSIRREVLALEAEAASRRGGRPPG